MNVALKRMTADGYLAWLNQQPTGRYELVNGQVVAMNPQLESVRHYLIVDPEQRTIVHHARNDKGGIATTLHSSGELTLSAIGARVSAEAFFAD